MAAYREVTMRERTRGWLPVVRSALATPMDGAANEVWYFGLPGDPVVRAGLR